MAETNASTNTAELVDITLTHHGKPHSFSLPATSTITELSEAISASLSVPPSNQKIMISKLGVFRQPFKDPELPISSFADKKITLMGSTVEEVSSLTQSAKDAAALRDRPKTARPTVKAYKTHDWKKEQEESQYTFITLRPLPYLPRPERSLKFLERLRDDAGIKAAMRKHKYTVPLLTEMNPIEHTQSDHEGTSRTLGLNRNRGEVIELRLRTDAYDGYRDYKTIRKTLCHELAHNIHGPHDRKFWDLCHQIEREVEGADWRSGGHSVGNEEFYEGANEEVDADHGGWTGGEFVLGASNSTVAPSRNDKEQGLSRREILAKAAEERIKRMGDSSDGGGPSTGGESR